MTPSFVLLLGLVQGVLEFLPVSSSGHLAVAHALAARWGGGVAGDAGGTDARTLDVMLHLATTASILVMLGPSLLRDLAERRFGILLAVIVGTLPLAALGILTPLPALGDVPLRVTVLLFACTAVFLFAAELFSPLQPDRQEPGVADALLIGLAQALAVAPGVSRSGMTLAAGFLCGLARPQAVRLAFLLAVPANLGAAAWQWRALPPGSPLGGAPVFAAMAVAFVAGCLTLRVAARFLVRRGLTPFAVYLLALSAVLALVL